MMFGFVSARRAILVLLPSVLTLCGEVVYDNIVTAEKGADGNPLFTTQAGEFGDEMQLAGKGRTITDFFFYYYGNFQPQGDESVIARFYKNNAPLPGEPDKIGPGTLLYQSDAVSIIKGYGQIHLKGLNVVVPDDFTFTVEFGGVTMVPGDEAGLLFYHPVAIGASFDDFWQKDNTGQWKLLAFPGLKSNFAALAIAASEAGVIRNISIVRRVARVTVGTTAGKFYELQARESFGPNSNWRTVSPSVKATSDGLVLADSALATAPSRMFRVVERSISISSANNQITVTSFATLGKRYRLEAGSNLGNWTPVSGPSTAAGSNITFTVAKTATDRQFYRVVELSGI